MSDGSKKRPAAPRAQARAKAEDAGGRPRKRASKPKPLVVNLALQGGGAHGAFTWGVLDRLLDEEDIVFECVTATSAGAMNGAMLTTGLKIGGRPEAKRRLAEFWGRIRAANPLNFAPWLFWSTAFLPPGFTPPGFANDLVALTQNPAYLLGDMVSRFVSPYQFNPADINPLREILETMIDFDAVCRTDDPRLFVCATDVARGRAKIFQGDEISVDALLASACLPFLYQAVEIDGVAYWDGGYTGNPSIWPLFYSAKSEDVIVVSINPIERAETPRDSSSIQTRVNEISFNSNLMSEMRAIEAMNRWIDQGRLPAGEFKRMRIHAIDDFETMRDFSVSTKLNPDAKMLDRLHSAGVAAASAWLEANKDKLGVDSSVDIRDMYL